MTEAMQMIGAHWHGPQVEADDLPPLELVDAPRLSGPSPAPVGDMPGAECAATAGQG